ncbi:hypothetical protein PR048_033009 [Dryococelus australis]|uniref:Uncharacterized protein n=1 Tax=Dryococelus australis TaxID=614101 RepID=A0ABQ9G3U9_9NEOP|nr:hypothetical protein PR048_033009 [Dryococelus australis]
MNAEELNVAKIQALFVSENCSVSSDLLTFLEGSTYPSAHALSIKLKDIPSNQWEIGLSDPCQKTFEVISFLFNPRNVCRLSIENTKSHTYIKNLPLVLPYNTEI